MVHYFTVSLFLLPIATTTGGDFWKDVDTLHDELFGHQDLPTQSTPNEAQQVQSTPPAAHHSQLPNEIDENQSGQRRKLVKRYYPKNLTVSATEIETFKRTIIIDKSYPQNISSEEIEYKLLALERIHEWYDLSTYHIDKYSKYWVKVCVFFWDKPLVNTQRYACTIFSSYISTSKRYVNVQNITKYLDLLCCRCHMYENNYKNNVSTPERFLIHKSNENEYFVFAPMEPEYSRYNLYIKDFKGGITLPIPVVEERGRSSKSSYIEKQVTLKILDMYRFLNALTIDKSYAKNISLAELEDKLKTFGGEIRQWPTLQEYSVDIYHRYWAKVCGVFWGKNPDSSLRQVCVLSPSYGIHRMRKLLIEDTMYLLDVLYCKCHSYTTNYRYPESAADTFLVHQFSKNEYFVFEQIATERSKYTLVIKGFKGGITLPDPDLFNY